MGPDLLRRKAIFAPFFSLFSASVGVLVFHIPLWNGPMYGDDYLLVKAALQPNGNTGFLQDLWLAGGGKWRPANTPIMLWLAKRWEFQYQPYQVLNLVLLVICASILGLAIYYISKSLAACALAAFTISVSHFTWLAQISVYGLMEFSAAILFLLACLGAMKSFSLIHEGSPRTTVCINLSAVLLLLSTLTHERYLLASFGFWAIFLFKETRPDNSHSYARLFLLIPLLHVFFKGIILGLSPLAGGGESSFQDVIGFWILHHFGDALLGLGGYYSGTGKFYSDWPLGKLGEQSDLRLLGFSMILIPLVLITISCLLKTRSDEYNNNGKSLKITFLFMMLVLTTLPSATVVQRIEFRWLFIPQALLLLLFTTCVSKYLINSRLKIPALLLPLLCFALISLHYRGDSKSFTLLRDQPSMLISSLEKVAPRQGYWILSLQQSDVTMPTYWQLGYGGVFTQMKNPPYLLVAKPDDCAAINANLPCISVFIRGASTNFEISKY